MHVCIYVCVCVRVSICVYVCAWAKTAKEAGRLKTIWPQTILQFKMLAQINNLFVCQCVFVCVCATYIQTGICRDCNWQISSFPYFARALCLSADNAPICGWSARKINGFCVPNFDLILMRLAENPFRSCMPQAQRN